MQELARIQLYLAFLDRAGISNVKALAFIDTEIGLAYFPWLWRSRGDHFDQTTGALIEALTAESHPAFLSPEHPGFAAEVRLYEGSRLKNSYGEFPFSIELVDRALNQWLRLERTGGSGSYVLQKSEWAQDEYKVQMWVDPRPRFEDWLFESATSALAALKNETKLFLDEALFQSTGMRVGDYVQVGNEAVDGSLAELYQIIDVLTGGGKTAATVEVTLDRPLAADWPEGTPVYRFAEGVVGPPDAPLVVPGLSDGGNPKLEWTPDPLSVPTHFDVEVASDTSFANVIWSVADTVSASASPATDLLDLDRVFLWRVRAGNSFGDGPWSVVMPLARTDSPTGRDEEPPQTINRLTLDVPYPNPASRITNLSFSLPSPGDYTVELYDMLGRRVRMIADAPFAAGYHTTGADVTGLPAGLYVVRLHGREGNATSMLSVVH